MDGSVMSQAFRLLFVYGTLRPGCAHPMARFLAERGRLLGRAKIQGRLYDLDWYPGLLEPAAADDWVQGDLYELADPDATLPKLDRYEIGASALFERRFALVRSEAEGDVTAWVYYYRGKVNAGQRIASGDYLNPGG
jgi:gamma-glutamylcyclotransferase (GGCT)/AIG2-like uncharacterized protein YtfP